MALGHWLKDYIGPHSGNGDPGYSCKEEITTVVNETVTTAVPTDPDMDPYPVGDISYNKRLNGDTINVTFNGIDYICERNVIDDYSASYGATESLDSFNWSEYPFRILTSMDPVGESEGNVLYTENAGVYNIKIDEVKTTIDITPCFKAAVKKAFSDDQS